MLNYVLRRLALGALVVVTVSLVTFLLVRLSGDIALMLAGEDATDEDVAAIRRAYDLDRSIVLQYLDWASGAFRGDFGNSLYFPLPALELIVDRLPVTLMLASLSLGLALLIAVPAGMAAAVTQGSLFDRLIRGFATLGQATPTFFLSLVLIIFLGVYFRWLPISGNTSWQHFVMPVIVLTIYVTPAFLRLVRSSMLEVLSADYIRTARAKGLAPWRVVVKHGLRNAVLPVVSLAAVQFGSLLEGSIIIETIYALDGIGMLAWQSIIRLDYVVIQALVFLASLVYVLLTTLADILNALLNPRLRDGYA